MKLPVELSLDPCSLGPLDFEATQSLQLQRGAFASEEHRFKGDGLRLQRRELPLGRTIDSRQSLESLRFSKFLNVKKDKPDVVEFVEIIFLTHENTIKTKRQVS